MVDRMKLPERRNNVSDTLKYPGWRPIQVSIGHTEELRAVEIFARSDFKQGSDMETLLDDASVLISLLLQSGYDLAELRRHLGRGEALEPESIIAALIFTAHDIEKEVQACG